MVVCRSAPSHRIIENGQRQLNLNGPLLQLFWSAWPGTSKSRGVGTIKLPSVQTGRCNLDTPHTVPILRVNLRATRSKRPNSDSQNSIIFETTTPTDKLRQPANAHTTKGPVCAANKAEAKLEARRSPGHRTETTPHQCPPGST
jgi:hypothetical protein